MIEWLGKLKHFEVFGLDLTLLKAIDKGIVSPANFSIGATLGSRLSFSLGSADDYRYVAEYDECAKKGFVSRLLDVNVSADESLKVGEHTYISVNRFTPMKLTTRFEVTSKEELAPALVKVLTLK